MTIGLIDDDSIAVTQQMIPRSILGDAILVAKIKGFKNLDQYIIDLIEDDLISIREGGQDVIEIGEKISEFLDKNEYLQRRYPSDPNTESEKDYVKIKMDGDLLKRFNKVQERKLEKEKDEDEEESKQQKEIEELKK